MQAKPADPVSIPSKGVKGKGKNKAAEIEVKGKAKAVEPLPKRNGLARGAQEKDRPKAAVVQSKDTQQQSAPKPL